MYNFGSPRIFNWPLAKNVTDTIPVIFRVSHYKDIFPHLPPCKTRLVNFRIVCIPGLDMEVEDVSGESIMVAEDFVAEEGEILLNNLGPKDDELKFNPFWAPW